MIITCTNCNKKFNIDSGLIPKSGRLVQCSSCDNQWFFKNNKEFVEREVTLNDVNLSNEKLKEENTSNENYKDEKGHHENYKEKPIISDKNEEKSISNTDENNILKKKKFKSARILNFILVFIITIVAFIIVLDTFQSPISIIIPDIEFILFNLYETFKDIFLFFKDLI